MGSQRVGHNLATKQKQKGLGTGEKWEQLVNGKRNSVWGIEKGLELYCSNLAGHCKCTRMCPLKMVKMVNFMLCLSYNIFYSSLTNKSILFTHKLGWMLVQLSKNKWPFLACMSRGTSESHTTQFFVAQGCSTLWGAAGITGKPAKCQ